MTVSEYFKPQAKLIVGPNSVGRIKIGDIYYEFNDNIVKARFTKSWTGKFAAELLRLKIYMFPTPSKLKNFLLYMNYDECGIAKCHPDDNFDVEYGKKLARKRLLKKYNRLRFLFFKELDNYLASCRNIVSARRDKYFLASEDA